MAEAITLNEAPIIKKQTKARAKGIPGALAKLANLASGQGLKISMMDKALAWNEKTIPVLDKLRDRFDAAEKRTEILNMSDADRRALKEKEAEKQRTEELMKTSEGRKILEEETQKKKEEGEERTRKTEQIIAGLQKDAKDLNFGEKLKTLAYKPKTTEEHRQETEDTINWIHKMNNLSKNENADVSSQKQNSNQKQAVKT